jgi:prepilin-type processing-associated H-X9-DG protein
MERQVARNVSIARLSLLVLGALCILPTPARAQGMTGYIVIFPSVGLAPDQSLRLTLFNRDGAPVRAQARIHHTGGANFMFLDGSVRAGEFHSFEFKRSDIALPGEAGTGRLQLSASLHLGLGGPRKKLDKLSVSMETVSISDGTSNTLFVGEILPSPSGGSGNGSLKSGFGNDTVMGIVPGQTLRVTLYNPPSFRPKARRNPVTGRVKFFDGSGNLIAQSGESLIPPGEFRSFELDRDALSLPGERGTGRLQTRASWSVARHASGRVAPSFELIDDLTGKTVVLSGQECLVFFLGGAPK